MTKPIVAVLRIDVEPDGFDAYRGVRPWEGFQAAEALLRTISPRLADRSGHVPHPTWFFRFDPHIAHCFGRADFAVHQHPAVVSRLQAAGDPFGIHVHPYRWIDSSETLFSEHADSRWLVECLHSAAAVFATSFGEPVSRMSGGGYFISEALIDAAIALGIKVDVTPEPGLGPKTQDPSFGAYATAPSPDYRGFPLTPYYPARDDIGRAAARRSSARPILLTPLTSYDYKTARRSWPRRVQALLLNTRQPEPLNPWKDWPSPSAYWDLVMRAADQHHTPFVALAIRTDDPASESARRVYELLEHLPGHPIAKRLHILDPLDHRVAALAAPAA